MFIFGKNNFRIKSFSPFELGLSKNPDLGYHIEIRQNYFHVIGIPCFDVGISWHIRKGAMLTAMPEPYRQQIDESKLRVSTPWRTFTGPIVVMLGLVIFNANNEWERRQSNQRAMVREAKTMDIIQEEKPSLSENNTYRVEHVSNDSIQ